MPYHDARRPFVNSWFASSEGSEIEPFVTSIAEANQDRLEQQHGACIMYTHLGCGFYVSGQLHERFKRLVERLARKNGWFVPVVTLLDYLAGLRGNAPITAKERKRLERRWLADKLVIGHS